jgi:hypothetical protein
MKIRIISDKTPGFIFQLVSDGTGEEDALTAVFYRYIEALNYLRALGAEFADRGNQTVDLEVSIWKTFGSRRDCGLFMLDLGNDVPATGRIELTIQDGNGASGLRIIEKASIPHIRPQPMGTSCLVTFSIHGGIVTKTPIGNPTS